HEFPEHRAAEVRRRRAAVSARQRGPRRRRAHAGDLSDAHGLAARRRAIGAIAMSIPVVNLTTTCDIYRPFGAGAPTTTGVGCRLVSDIERGLLTGSSVLTWSHYIDVDDSVDIRDACGRLGGGPGIVYADGDEVRIPNASGSRYVV